MSKYTEEDILFRMPAQTHGWAYYGPLSCPSFFKGERLITYDSSFSWWPFKKRWVVRYRGDSSRFHHLEDAMKTR